MVRALPPAFQRTDSVDDTDFSVRAGVTYGFSDNANTYFTYTQGYKGPAFNVFFNMGLNNSPAIGAETADAFELGLKTVLLDGALTANFAAFNAEYENFQANSFININGVLTTNLTNAGDVRTRGLEADFVWDPTDNFTLSGAATFMDAEVTGVNIPDGADQGSNRQPARADRHAAAVRAGFRSEPHREVLHSALEQRLRHRSRCSVQLSG